MRRIISCCGCVIVTLATLSLGCRNGASEEPALSPMQRAVRRGQADLEEGRAEALEAADDQPSFVLELRYNPGQCEAPDYEVRARGRWTRAILEPADAEVEAALARFVEDAARRPFARLRVEAAPRRARTSARGIEWPVFEVLAIPPPEPGGS